MVVIKGILEVAIAFGPTFSNHVWSIVWLASAWPKTRFAFGVRRWMIGGKNPSIFEKWWVVRLGDILYCLLVRRASSRAVSSPITVTNSAASFIVGGMDMTGVFKGVMLEVIRRPAIILPHASRFNGLITAGLFSLMGEIELNRG